jgi:hypothetical protein
VTKPDSTDLWCTPYGLFWNEVKASDIISIDKDGNVIGGMWDVTPAVAIPHRIAQGAPRREGHHPQPSVSRHAVATLHRLPEIADQQACLFDDEIVLFNEYTGGVD